MVRKKFHGLSLLLSTMHTLCTADRAAVNPCSRGNATTTVSIGMGRYRIRPEVSGKKSLRISSAMPEYPGILPPCKLCADNPQHKQLNPNS